MGYGPLSHIGINVTTIPLFDIDPILTAAQKKDWSNKSLVGGFNPSEKYEFVSWDDSEYPLVI